jgi:hypothetical protein
MAVHRFGSTGEAYDACQCDEGIRDGDVLVVEPEGVVGVADTWPFAVTRETGVLHGIRGRSVLQVRPDLERGRLDAIEVAVRMGLGVDWGVLSVLEQEFVGPGHPCCLSPTCPLCTPELWSGPDGGPVPEYVASLEEDERAELVSKARVAHAFHMLSAEALGRIVRSVGPKE